MTIHLETCFCVLLGAGYLTFGGSRCLLASRSCRRLWTHRKWILWPAKEINWWAKGRRNSAAYPIDTEECCKCSESQWGLVHRGAGLRRPGWAPFPALAHAVPWDLMPTVPCLCSAGLASLALHFLQVQPYSLLAYRIAVQLFLLCSAAEVSFWLRGLWYHRSQACPKKWMFKLSLYCWPVQLSSGAFCSMWLMPVFVSLCFHALLISCRFFLSSSVPTLT